MSMDNLRKIKEKFEIEIEIEEELEELIQTYNKEIKRLKAEIEKLKEENYYLKYNKNAL